LRGAGVAGYRLNPKYALVLEGTFAQDMPDVDDKVPRMGEGPVVTIADRSIIISEKFVDFIVKSAKETKIPHQLKRPLLGGTDAGRIHLQREGILSGVISIPCRYIHSPIGLASKKDVEGGKKLAEEVILNLQKGKYI
jgi:endoglucanase